MIVEATFIDIGAVWIQRDTSYRRTKAYAKNTNTQMWWTHGFFPSSVKEGVVYAVERHLEPCCKLKLPRFEHPFPSFCFFFLFGWTRSSTAYPSWINILLSLICWWLFVVWATTKKCLLCGSLLKFPRILNSWSVKYLYTLSGHILYQAQTLPVIMLQLQDDGQPLPFFLHFPSFNHFLSCLSPSVWDDFARKLINILSW